MPSLQEVYDELRHVCLDLQEERANGGMRATRVQEAAVLS